MYGKQNYLIDYLGLVYFLLRECHAISYEKKIKTFDQNVVPYKHASSNLKTIGGKKEQIKF